jgi:hypothetical protein
MTTIENNPSKKGKKRGLKRCWKKRWQFTSFYQQTFLKLIWKKIIMFVFSNTSSLDQIVMNDLKFKCYVTYNLSMKHSIWTSIFLSKALVSTNYFNIVVLFSAMAKTCS